MRSMSMSIRDYNGLLHFCYVYFSHWCCVNENNNLSCLIIYCLFVILCNSVLLYDRIVTKCIVSLILQLAILLCLYSYRLYEYTYKRIEHNIIVMLRVGYECEFSMETRFFALIIYLVNFALDLVTVLLLLRFEYIND